MMGPWAIEVQGLGKHYRGGRGGIAGVNLQVGPDEAWLLAGPNGAGKTTLVHCVLGLLRPDVGQVQVLGMAPRQARSQLGYQAEIFAVHGHLTAAEVLTFFARLAGMEAGAMRPRADLLLRQLDLWAARDRKVGTYSKGMLQRLGVAQSLLADPQLLIWDEPVSGLDPDARRVVLDLALAHKAKGRPLMVCTHVLADVCGLCDHVAIVAGGRLLLAGPVAALMAAGGHSDLEALYLATTRAAAAGADGP